MQAHNLANPNLGSRLLWVRLAGNFSWGLFHWLAICRSLMMQYDGGVHGTEKKMATRDEATREVSLIFDSIWTLTMQRGWQPLDLGVRPLVTMKTRKFRSFTGAWLAWPWQFQWPWPCCQQSQDKTPSKEAVTEDTERKRGQEQGNSHCVVRSWGLAHAGLSWRRLFKRWQGRLRPQQGTLLLLPMYASFQRTLFKH